MNTPPKKKKRRRKGADRLPPQPRELHLPSLFPEFPNDEVLMEQFQDKEIKTSKLR